MQRGRRKFLGGIGALLTFGAFEQRVMAEANVSDPLQLTANPTVWQVKIWIADEDDDYIAYGHYAEQGLYLSREQASARMGEQLAAKYRNACLGVSTCEKIWSQNDEDISDQILDWFRRLCEARLRRDVGNARGWKFCLEELQMLAEKPRDQLISWADRLPYDFDLPDDLTVEEIMELNAITNCVLGYVKPITVT